MQSWRLDDGQQTLLLAARRERLPEVVYWGPLLPAEESAETLASGHWIDVTGGMLDENPELSICPEAVRTFPGQPGLIVRDTDGTPLLPKFCFEGDAHSDNRAELVLTFSDTENALKYTATFRIDTASHLITAQAVLEATRPVHLHWLAAPVLPAPQHSDEMIDFTGRWCGEFQTAITPPYRLRAPPC